MVNQQTGVNQAHIFISECEKKGISIDYAYLFGSYANGNMREDSDIDLILVSEDFDSTKRYANLQKIMPVHVHFPNFSVLTYSKKDYLNGIDFVEHIKPTAIQLK
jgi:predicted nucleotidyltransferase